MKLTGVDGSIWAFMKKNHVPSRDGSRDYLVRWRLIQTPWFAVYLHKILIPDEDEHMHDHPWNFKSLILSNGYWETTPRYDQMFSRFHLNRHKAEDFHRIEFFEDKTRPVWSLMFIGKRRREWGFNVDGTWVDHRTYLGLSEEDYL